MPDMLTSARRRPFRYEGSVSGGVEIFFGREFRRRVAITQQQFNDLLEYFNAAEVAVGTSRGERRTNSLGDWLRTNITQEAIASYVAPILMDEGYAQIVPDRPFRIRFVRQR